MASRTARASTAQPVLRFLLPIVSSSMVGGGPSPRRVTSARGALLLLQQLGRLHLQRLRQRADRAQRRVVAPGLDLVDVLPTQPDQLGEPRLAEPLRHPEPLDCLAHLSWCRRHSSVNWGFTSRLTL